MTIEKIVIKVSNPGVKGYEDFEIEMKLSELMKCLEYRTTSTGEYDPTGSYPKGLWLFIEGWYQSITKPI